MERNKNLSKLTDAELERYREELEEELMNVLWYLKIRKKYKAHNQSEVPKFENKKD